MRCVFLVPAALLLLAGCADEPSFFVPSGDVDADALDVPDADGSDVDANDVADGETDDVADGETDVLDDADLDTTSDADPDVAEDGTNDAEPADVDVSVDADASADVDSSPPAERCADGVDNDGDGATDCADADCALDPACSGCPDGEVFFNGNCVATGQTPETYTASDFVSYIYTLAIPPSGTDAECCFDLNGDDNIDNALSSLVDLLGGLGEGLDFGTLINDAIIAGDIAILMEWTRWEDEADFSVWTGTNDLDGDGAPDDDFATRASGEGTFRLQADGFNTAAGIGAAIQFNGATLDGSALDSGLSAFALSIPVSDASAPLVFRIVNARITASMAESRGRIASIPERLNNGEEDVEYGGAELGGVILMDEVFDILDDLARDCSCVEGIDGTTPVLEYGDNGEFYAASCVQIPGDASACTETDGILCEQLSTVCTFAGSIPELVADVDVDGNEVDDALSVGIRLGWVGAALATPLFSR